MDTEADKPDAKPRSKDTHRESGGKSKDESVKEDSPSRRRPRRKAAVSATKVLGNDPYTMLDDSDESITLEDSADEFKLDKEEAAEQEDDSDDNQDKEDGNESEEIDLNELKNSSAEDNAESDDGLPPEPPAKRSRQWRKATSEDDDDYVVEDDDDATTTKRKGYRCAKLNDSEKKMIAMVEAVGRQLKREPEAKDFQDVALEHGVTMTQVRTIWNRHLRMQGKASAKRLPGSKGSRTLPQKMKRPEKLRRRRGANTSLGEQEDLFVLMVSGLSQEVALSVEWAAVTKIFHSLFKQERIPEELRRRANQLGKVKAAKLDMQAFLRSALGSGRKIRSWGASTQALIVELMEQFRNRTEGNFTITLPDTIEELLTNYDVTGAEDATGLRVASLTARQRDFLEHPSTVPLPRQHALIAGFLYAVWEIYFNTEQGAERAARAFVRAYHRADIEMVIRQLLAEDMIAALTKRKDWPAEPIHYCFSPRAMGVMRLDWDKDIFEQTRQVALEAIAQGSVTLEREGMSTFGAVAFTAEAAQSGEAQVPVKFNRPKVGDTNGKLNTRSIYAINGAEAVTELVDLPEEGLKLSDKYIAALKGACIPLDERYNMPMLRANMETQASMETLPDILASAGAEHIDVAIALWDKVHQAGAAGLTGSELSWAWSALATQQAIPEGVQLSTIVGYLLDSGCMARLPTHLMANTFTGVWQYVSAPNATQWCASSKRQWVPYCWNSPQGSIAHHSFDALAGVVLYYVCQKPGISESELYKLLHPLIPVFDASSLVAYLIHIKCISRIVTLPVTRSSFFAPHVTGARDTDIPLLHDVLGEYEINAFVPCEQALTTFSLSKADDDDDEDDSRDDDDDDADDDD
eukprot:TRINITY_DN11458_c0_g1_i3.p1 TRINITY_DN11458_c0_g1~~TRINITY_DN11458_c0_g1_i3.p1  ORF type:complete len:863 (+),score=241.08 TRINITY_DN11458_c0_g1_i3:110-2698(+)